ncbi:PD-(D/E)XK nuclease family protein [Patescibacteria group bacterium]|nr:PD-(D/E)XK nuclease family protein [Patescibacteria group bacterium]
MRISYSAIDTYKTCPLKYKYQEIDKIKVPKSKEAVFGTALHASLKFMFSRDPLYPTLDEVVNFYLDKWAHYTTKAVWNDESEVKAFQDQGIAILKKFYSHNQPWNFNVLDLESRFEVPLTDEHTGETHTLAGIIDRIDKPDDNTYEIIDYKTGRRMPSQETLDQNLQLSIYHLGLVRRWPHIENKNIRLTLHFLKHGEKISTTRTADDLERTKKTILGTIHEIHERKSKDDFPPTPSALCNWCGYRPICPVWKHLYQKDKKTPNKEEITRIIKEYFELKVEAQKNSARIKELHAMLADYMKEEDVLRLFSDEGYIAKTVKTAEKYDFDRVKEILEPLGKWSEVLKADEKKLAMLLPTLSTDIQQKIKEVSTQKTTETLTVTRKKISSPLDI